MGGSIYHHIKLCNIIIKHPWTLALVLWPWYWKVCPCQFSTCINHLKMATVTHSTRLGNMASLSILELWPWCCYLDLRKIVQNSSQLVLISVLKMNGQSHIGSWKTASLLSIHDLCQSCDVTFTLKKLSMWIFGLYYLMSAFWKWTLFLTVT